jgi:tRNA A37 threonylcarbamoyladenosine dehydratase
MLHAYSRTELLIGKEGLEILASSKIAIFGIGGVGSYVVEGLVRAGIGKFVLVDDDKICITNLNRQIHATRKTVGRNKVDVMKERILEINPKAEVETFQTFYLPDTGNDLIKNDYSYIVDAIDTVTGKIGLVMKAQELSIPIICSMGTGNKINPAMLQVADIYKTTVDPLARVMRKELRARGVKKLKVIYSVEEPIMPKEDVDLGCKAGCVCPPGTERKCTDRRNIPGSISFVPSCAGLIIAGEVVKDLLKYGGTNVR